MAIVDGRRPEIDRANPNIGEASDVDYINEIDHMWMESGYSKTESYTHQHDKDPEPVRKFFKEMINE